MAFPIGDEFLHQHYCIKKFTPTAIPIVIPFALLQPFALTTMARSSPLQAEKDSKTCSSWFVSFLSPTNEALLKLAFKCDQSLST